MSAHFLPHYLYLVIVIPLLLTHGGGRLWQIARSWVFWTECFGILGVVALATGLWSVHLYLSGVVAGDDRMNMWPWENPTPAAPSSGSWKP